METIKVNMNPNPLDVQTIHASQNDNEGREWGFELHNNGDKIDSSSISDQMVFKAYEGGTEQILPTNGSVPSTAPIIADIKYPQGELTDQEFLYRESPTQEDGLAKLTRVKGNTLAFNQLALTLASGNYNANRSTIAYSNNVATVTTNGNDGFGFYRSMATVVGHEYLFTAKVKPSKVGSLRLGLDEDSAVGNRIGFSSTEEKTVSRTWTCATANSPLICYYYNNTIASGDNYTITNLMVIDLTLMGITADQFKSYFPLPYYSYQSTLLPFKGTGIKTTGTNLIDYATIEQGSLDFEQGTTYPIDTRVRTSFIYLEQGSYTVTSYMNGYDVVIYMYNSGKTFDRNNSIINWQTTPKTFTMAYDGYVKVVFRKTDNSIIRPSEITSERMYDNNTESTTNLPTLTYFPNGMKSARNVYDELLPNKAKTRVGAYTITSFQGKSGATANNLFSANAIMNLIKKPSADSVLANIKSNYGEAKTMTVLYNNDTVGVAINTNGTIYVGFGKNGSVTTLAQANAYVQSNPITVYYELATPTETPITTASLVTENAEIPLSNEDGVLIGKCTEQLSENPGFIDAKIKLSDSDGECYSNKLQLHVERSPQ